MLECLGFVARRQTAAKSVKVFSIEFSIEFREKVCSKVGKNNLGDHTSLLCIRHQFIIKVSHFFILGNFSEEFLTLEKLLNIADNNDTPFLDFFQINNVINVAPLKIQVVNPEIFIRV